MSQPFGRFLAMLLVAAAWTVIAAAEGDEFVPPTGLSEGWYARIETGRGRIVARLLPEQAPQAVAHFAALAEGRLEWTEFMTGKRVRGHFYDGVKIHLAQAGRLFEAGDRTGSGVAAPPFFIADEGLDGPVTMSRGGRLGMIRSSSGRMSGVQFFVSAAGMPWLNGKRAVFGEVVSGEETVFALTSVKTDPAGVPLEPQVIERIRVFSVGTPSPLPEPERYVTVERMITPARVKGPSGR